MSAHYFYRGISSAGKGELTLLGTFFCICSCSLKTSPKISLSSYLVNHYHLIIIMCFRVPFSGANSEPSTSLGSFLAESSGEEITGKDSATGENGQSSDVSKDSQRRVAFHSSTEPLNYMVSYPGP